MNNKRQGLRVLFAASECAPWVKTGGLGDIASALPVALRALGIDVRLLLPGYPAVAKAASGGRTAALLPPLGAYPAARLVQLRGERDVPVYVVDCPQLFDRPGGPYQDPVRQDWPDNAWRFGLLSRVAALVGSGASPLRWRPSVVHCNDWQTGLAPAFVHFDRDAQAQTIQSIHNLAFQGVFSPGLVTPLGLPAASFSMHGIEYYGNLSFLKAGLFYADAITTVSPTYAEQIQSLPLGMGMQGLLASRRDVLAGILNGIDTAVWDPATDSHLARNYDAATLDRKQANKRALQERLGLAVDAQVPLFAGVTRLTYQKGTDLLIEIAPRLVDTPAQLVILGTGDPPLEAAVAAVAGDHPGRIAAVIGFEEPLAHLIEAGADIFLMPSRFEPCGMNQMYSQRYGTPPVAHATGGLIDSIVDTTVETLAERTASGFLFPEASAAGLMSAVDRALAIYRHPTRWRCLQLTGMTRDFSWGLAAGRYATLYDALAGNAAAVPAAADDPQPG